MGSLYMGELVSRSRVVDDPDLAFISLRVWPNRDRDPKWLDYVSLSVNSINLDLWERAVANLPDRWWAIMAFDPEILDRDGVWFATTNNIYPSCRRDQGPGGLLALYGDPVVGRHGVEHRRLGLDRAQPTDRAAEALFPDAVGLEHLRAIYVASAEHRRTIRAWCRAMDVMMPPVHVNPERFA